MYLDQPGLMKLWDRMKAVFAPKSHTHQASDVSGVIQNGAELMTTNPFSPLPKLYISKIDNAFYAADKRFNVSAEVERPDGSVVSLDSVWVAMFFDGDYESCYHLKEGYKLILRMKFDNQPSGKFPGYPYGNILVSAYNDEVPKSIGVRVYNSYESQGVGWHDLNATDISVSLYKNAWSFRNPYYGVQEIEFTFVGSEDNTYKYTGITQIEMHLDRPYSGRNPFLSKYSAEELYYPLKAPKFIGNADTATEIKENAGVNASLEKLPVWSEYPLDNTQLIRRDNGGVGRWGRVTFLTVWNYIKGKADALYAAKSHTHKASDITGLSANAADYVVAQGKCDFWTWRMWKSGVSECWGSTGETYENVASEWGYLYEGSAHSNGFPGNTSESSALAFSVKLDGVTYKRLFKNVPEFCSCSFNPTGGAGISGIEIGGGLSALSTPTVYLLRPTSASIEGHYSYHAKGRWK